MDIHAHRKDEHVFIAEKQYRPIADNGLDQVRLLPATLPELGLDEDNAHDYIGWKTGSLPFLYQCNDWWESSQTDKINEKLAYVAKTRPG